MNNTHFTLIAQQEDFVVVNKNNDINFHDEDDSGQGLFNQVKKQLNLTELYPVHRLDKMTSGLVIMAKNLPTARQFQLLFADHQIEKYYLALSDKKPNKKQGLIRGDMGKSRRGTYKLLRSQNNPAITQFLSYSVGNGLRLFVIKPHSGKTHQIRVALSSIGAPILGDPSYYTQSNSDRGYLHAYAVRFTLNNQQYSFVCPPNSGKLFHQSRVMGNINDLSSPWQLNWPRL